LLVDTHCHLYLLDGSVDELVAQARAEGVDQLVDVGIDLPSSRQAADDAARLAPLAATAGVHPHEASLLDAAVLDQLRRLLEREEVVAAGETGLDYYRDRSPRAAQRAAFAAHVRLASQLDKALVVHCREAFEDVVAVLEATGPPERVVFHCFTGDAAQAARVVEAGWLVSFAGTVTFRNAADQREACAAVPLDRMVLETDSPFLSPHPYRGQPNRPGRVALTAATVAAVHGVPVQEVARVTGATARRAFRLPPAGA
jgi:TatD DNase family protein